MPLISPSLTDLSCALYEAKPKDPAFCLALSWGPPHNDYCYVPEKYRALYDPEKLHLRPNCKPIPRESLDPKWSQLPTTRDYYAMITSLDDQLGRLLAELDHLGIADNTLVVFTSDHGDMMWSQGLLYKCVPFEESVQVPLLLRWPQGLPQNQVCNTLIGSVDLLPTLAGLLGWDAPSTFEGVNVTPWLRGQPIASEPDAVFMAFYNKYVFRPDFPVPEWRGLRTARHTFAVRTDRSCWMLYDNENDPWQLHNLADDPGSAGLRTELSRRLDRFLTETGDPFLDRPGMSRHFKVTVDYWY